MKKRNKKCFNRAVYKKTCLNIKCQKDFEVIRYEINGELIPIRDEKSYCSRSCANGHIHTKEWNEKISKTISKNRYGNKRIKTHCKMCDNILSKGNKSGYCNHHYSIYRVLSEETKEKQRESGRKSSEIQRETRRSKNEKLFCEMCEQHFKNVKHNEPIFNGWDADIILEDLKIAVLWNGKWHYESIGGHSVEQVQNRDQIKLKEIKIFGYTAYIIKDMGKYNLSLVQEEFDKFYKLFGNIA